MCPTVCRWADPGRPGPKTSLDRLCGEHLSCRDTVSIREDPLLLFWLLFCAVGTTKRQIPKGHLLRETGVIPFCRLFHFCTENYMPFWYCSSHAIHAYAVTDMLNTQLWQLSPSLVFLSQTIMIGWWGVLFYRLRLWKVNRTKPREVFTHAGASNCIHSLFFNSIWLLISSRLYCHPDKWKTWFDYRLWYLILKREYIFLSVVVKYFPAHYVFQWYFFVLLCWYVVLEEIVWIIELTDGKATFLSCSFYFMCL